MGTENSKGYIQVESERIATLEAEVDGIHRDVGEIKSDISAIKKDGTETKVALTEISMTLKAINDVKPRVEALERFKYKAMGVMAVVMFLLSMFGPNIRALLFG
ncbi:hypothetical protein KKJFFJLC_00016 [Vibrio phage vB_VpaS_PGB]|nr:hypothetical protein HHKILHMN_00018 [Vibrio phage vB_VpaS_PGA]WVH05559.1 hypothetical protein KKJFFJLC_00016 [Vibrio phage vB_VpaS_PGB]